MRDNPNPIYMQRPCINRFLSSINLHLYFLPFQIPDYRNAVIVAKNPRAARRATSYAERLRLAIAVIHGEVKVR